MSATTKPKNTKPRDTKGKTRPRRPNPERPNQRAALYGRQSHGKKKPIKDQMKAGRRRSTERVWPVMGEYDDGSSAGPHRTKDRKDWSELWTAVDHGLVDVILVWEVARCSRDMTDWFPFLKLCGERGVVIHVINHDRTYDPGKSQDWAILAKDGVDAQLYVLKLSEDVQRGVNESAEDGKPHGRVLYGYHRFYDQHTREFVAQRVHLPHAKVVRRIIRHVSKKKPTVAIQNELNNEKIPSPIGGRWNRNTIRSIVRNRGYLGLRVHWEDEYAAVWPQIIGPKTFAAAQAVLDAPDRKASAPGAARWLLSYIAECGVCDGQMQARRGDRGHVDVYACLDRGCVAVPVTYTNGLLARLWIRWISPPEAEPIFDMKDDAVTAKMRKAVANSGWPTCAPAAPTRYTTPGGAMTGDDPAHLVAACRACNVTVGDPLRHDPAPTPRTAW